MQVIIMPTKADASELAARIIAKRVGTFADSVIGLATGQTMERLYARLAQKHQEDGLDFSLVRTYNLDEYIGMAADDPNSYRSYMNELLFNKVNIDLRNTHLPLGMADDLDHE